MFLKVGMTFAIFNLLGYIPVATDKFIISFKGMHILLFIICNISVGILWGPVCFAFNQRVDD